MPQVAATGPRQNAAQDVYDRQAQMRDRGSALRRFFAAAKQKIEASAAGPFMRKASVLDAEMLNAMGDLIDITNDRDALMRLQQHPDVQTLTSEVAIQELTNDPEIRAAARDRRILDLLNHPKVAEVAKNEKLLAKLKGADFDAIIAHAKGTSP